jgi:hypothetical protein
MLLRAAWRNKFDINNFVWISKLVSCVTYWTPCENYFSIHSHPGSIVTYVSYVYGINSDVTQSYSELLRCYSKLLRVTQMLLKVTQMLLRVTQMLLKVTQMLLKVTQSYSELLRCYSKLLRCYSESLVLASIRLILETAGSVHIPRQKPYKKYTTRQSMYV